MKIKLGILYLITYMTTSLPAQDSFFKYYFNNDVITATQYMFLVNDTVYCWGYTNCKIDGLNRPCTFMITTDTLGNQLAWDTFPFIQFLEKAIIYEPDKDHFLLTGLYREFPPSRDYIMAVDRGGDKVQV